MVFHSFYFYFYFFLDFNDFLVQNSENSIFLLRDPKMNSFWSKSGASVLKTEHAFGTGFRDKKLDPLLNRFDAYCLLISCKTMSKTRSGASRFRRVPPSQPTQNHMIFKLKRPGARQMTSGVENAVFSWKKYKKSWKKYKFLSFFWLFFWFSKKHKKSENFGKISIFDFFVKINVFFLWKTLIFLLKKTKL